MGKDARTLKGAERLPVALCDFDVSFIGVCVPQIWIYCIAHRADGALGEVALGVPLYSALTLAMAASLMFSLRGKLPVGAPWIAWPLAVLQGAATVLLVAPGLLAPLVGMPGVFLAAALCAGVGVAWLYLQWAPFFASLDTKSIVACVFIAMAAGSALKVPLDLAPAPAAAAVLCLMPALSVILARRADARPRPAAAPPRLFHEENPTAVPWRILFAVGVYSFAIGAVKGVPVTADPVPFAALTLVHHAVEILLALGLLWWVFGLGRPLRFSALWRAVLLFTAATLFFLPWAGPAWAPWLQLGAGIAQTLVVMLLWAMLADVAHHTSAAPCTVFASGWIAYSLPLVLGEVAGSLAGTAPDHGLYVAVLAYGVTVTVVLALSDGTFSQRRIFADLGGASPAPSAFASLDARCEELGAARGLTAREVEVLRMIVKGRSKSYIAENLFISENTVRSHSKHIYQKLDVHSKQEVLDLLGMGEGD